MPTYDVRSGKVRARVFVDGRQISKTFDNKVDAKLWSITAENLVPDERWTPPNFRYVLEQYQALELEGRDNDQILVKRLCRENWTKIPLDELTDGHLSQYKNAWNVWSTKLLIAELNAWFSSRCAASFPIRDNSSWGSCSS